MWLCKCSPSSIIWCKSFTADQRFCCTHRSASPHMAILILDNYNWTLNRSASILHHDFLLELSILITPWSYSVSHGILSWPSSPKITSNSPNIMPGKIKSIHDWIGGVRILFLGHTLQFSLVSISLKRDQTEWLSVSMRDNFIRSPVIKEYPEYHTSKPHIEKREKISSRIDHTTESRLRMTWFLSLTNHVC